MLVMLGACLGAEALSGCPALPNDLTYLSPLPPWLLISSWGGAGGPGVRSLVQQPRDGGCVWGTAPFVPFSHARTCLCVQTVHLRSVACGQRGSVEGMVAPCWHCPGPQLVD